MSDSVYEAPCGVSLLGPMAPDNWDVFHVLIRGESLHDVQVLRGRVTGKWVVRLGQATMFEVEDQDRAAYVASVLAEGIRWGASRGDHRGQARFLAEERPRPRLVPSRETEEE